jgi:hypothetical protein
VDVGPRSVRELEIKANIPRLGLEVVMSVFRQRQ